MKLQCLHLLAVSLLSPAWVFQAAAQTPAASANSSNSSTTFFTISQHDFTRLSTPTTPSASSTPVLTSPEKTISNPFEFRISKRNVNPMDLHLADRSLDSEFKPQELAQLAAANNVNTLVARVTSPCYSMRVYGFTAQDLKSSNPKSSTQTDCTPTSSVHLKPLQLPSTLNPK
jgi:hypothetical protein